jgi:hypothetical protein
MAEIKSKRIHGPEKLFDTALIIQITTEDKELFRIYAEKKHPEKRKPGGMAEEIRQFIYSKIGKE